MLEPVPLAPISLAVVGVGHPNPDRSKSNRRFEIQLCKPGERVELRLEPKNKADPRAVAVFSDRGIQIGYVSAERCGRIGAIIRSGREYRAVFQREVDHGAWIRVAFDGEVPVVDPDPPRWVPRVAAPLAEDGVDEDYGWPDE